MRENRRSIAGRQAVCILVALLFLFFCTGCSLFSPKGPEEEPDHVSLFVTEAEINVGAQFTLSYNADTQNLEWASSREDIATVEKGVVTGVGAGVAVISVSDGKTLSTCTVTVKPRDVGLKITFADATLSVGDSMTLATSLPKGYDAVWNSTAPLVATVDGGVVSAVGTGTAEISAICDELRASCTITVIPVRTEEEDRLLIWSDEFEGDALDGNKWEYQTGIRDVYTNGITSEGPEYWGNVELQYYTRDAVKVSGGNLVITAARKDGLPNGRGFTSARITTRDRGYWTYGYFEARMKLPLGTGMWPAFWMLPEPAPNMGTQNRYGGWPANGEIDIMEAKGRVPGEVGNTLHFGGSPHQYNFRVAKVDSISEWHVYGFEWRADHMSWFVDGQETFRLKNTAWHSDSAMGKDNPVAPFDVPFYLVLNLAVGGNYDGYVAPPADFVSADMVVDYVRVYA